MTASINLDDIDPEQRKKLGIRKPRETAFSKDELQGWSLKILALMANLSRAERQPCYGMPSMSTRSEQRQGTEQRHLIPPSFEGDQIMRSIAIERPFDRCEEYDRGSQLPPFSDRRRLISLTRR